MGRGYASGAVLRFGGLRATPDAIGANARQHALAWETRAVIDEYAYPGSSGNQHPNHAAAPNAKRARLVG